MKKVLALLLMIAIACGMTCAFAEDGADEGERIALAVAGVETTAAELEAEIRLYMFMSALECAGEGEEYNILDPENIDDKTYYVVMDIEDRIADRILAEEAGIDTLTSDDEEALTEEANETWERYRAIAWSDDGMAFLPAGDYEVIDGDPEGNITRYFASFGLTEDVLLAQARAELIGNRLRAYVTDPLTDMSRDAKTEYYVQWRNDRFDELGVEEDPEVILLVMGWLAEDSYEYAGDDFDAYERSVMINDQYYELGTSTLRDLEDAGWIRTQEDDGVYAFEVPETGSWFYVRTENDDPEGLIVMIDLMWADGLEAEYMGIDVSAEGDGDDENLWDYLKEVYDAETNDDGTLQAWDKLEDGRVLLIETKDRTIRLTLTAGE